MLEGGGVVDVLLVGLVVVDDPGGAEGPLLRQVHPRRQLVPVELDLERLHQPPWVKVFITI